MLHGDRLRGIVVGEFLDLAAFDIGRRHHELDLTLRDPIEVDIAL
jgi:hypothetical protein